MIYVLLIIAMGLGALAALASLIAAIVQTARTRWKSAAAWAVLLVLLLVGVAGTGLWVAANGAWDLWGVGKRTVQQIQDEETKKIREQEAARAAPLLGLTPEALRAGIDDEFWTYRGTHDWYRRPLRFPFVVLSITTLEKGSLARNTNGGKCSAPPLEDGSLDDITRYAFDGKMFLFQQEKEGKKTWLLYGFDPDSLMQEFASEAELLKAARAGGFDGPLVLKTVKQRYDEYWK
jgi:hypothetical protein